MVEFDKENKKIYINGVENDVIAYITNPKGNYVVYTSNEQLNDGRIVLKINYIEPKDDKVLLGDVTDNELLDIINELKERMNVDE